MIPMNKVAVLLVLALMGGGAKADWTRLGGNAKTTTYVDADTIKRKGDIVSMWLLDDLVVPDSHGQSYRYLDEFDCENRLLRMIYISTHSGKMAKGDMLTNGNAPGNWEQVPPGTVSGSLYKFACSVPKESK